MRNYPNFGLLRSHYYRFSGHPHPPWVLITAYTGGAIKSTDLTPYAGGVSQTSPVKPLMQVQTSVAVQLPLAPPQVLSLRPSQVGSKERRFEQQTIGIAWANVFHSGRSGGLCTPRERSGKRFLCNPRCKCRCPWQCSSR